NIKIDLNDPKFLKLGSGKYKLIINLQMPGINRDIILGSPNIESQLEPYLAIYNKVIVKYNAKGDLCFFIKEQHSGITKSYFKDNNLYLEGWFDDKKSKNELMLYKREKMPVYVKINRDFKFNKLILDKFPNATGFTAIIPNNLIKNLKDWKYFVEYYKNDQRLSLTGNKINKKKIYGNYLLHLHISESGDINLIKHSAKTYLKSYNWENNILKLSACLNKSSLGKQVVIDSKLRCVSKKYGTTISIGEKSIEETKNVLKNTFIVKTKDELNNNLFISDDWEFYVDYHVKPDNVISHKITLTSSKFKNKIFKTHKYKLINSNGFLGLKVSLIWSREANTTRKREALERYIYPLMRLLPINKKRIVFESYWTNKYNCNPRYLYEYIDKNHPEYDCIWAFFDESMKIKGNGKKVRFRSLKYFYYMATAKYFVNNVNFPDFYNKRKGAVEIQTMHGTPLKTLGIDVPGDFTTEESLNKYIKRCNRWDYLVVSSDKVADITKQCFMFEKEFLKSGYPRIDEIFMLNTPKTINKIKKELNIPENKKVILYAPTWRVKNKFDLMLDFKTMKEKLGDEYILLLRAHPLSAKGLKRELLNDFVIDVTGYNSIEELYIISDVMITDYSSAMFDYGVLDKPMIFFTYDLDLYKNNLRGFYLNFEEEAPGPIVSTSNEVIEELLKLDSIKSRYRDKINAFYKNYCQYEKGNACKNIFDTVFDKNNNPHKEENVSPNIFDDILKEQT
ncbi:CDP-glycerol glycerophosphotransferase family protein, partial [Methanobacterium sp.]|uniref:CDP-glycerol glycerophosphotransferase family protein n=1 Tax=Methanobacterium sp. TaxID=2164 RepID=UPI0031599340